ncbi:hypothetical protein B0H10DRAFT_2120622 [Mycena sp. CBHHK59/15]|nr:hypothetical protein B0H10DRAFT_2120622 [Mycena sp. CBHHK59/15]
MGRGVWLRAPENPDLDDPRMGKTFWVPNALPSVREVSDTETCDVPPLEGPPPKVELLVASVVLCNPDPSPGEDELPDNSSVTFTAPVYGPSAVSMENVTATVNFYQNAFFEGFRELATPTRIPTRRIKRCSVNMLMADIYIVLIRGAAYYVTLRRS